MLHHKLLKLRWIILTIKETLICLIGFKTTVNLVSLNVQNYTLRIYLFFTNTAHTSLKILTFDLQFSEHDPKNKMHKRIHNGKTIDNIRYGGM